MKLSPQIVQKLRKLVQRKKQTIQDLKYTIHCQQRQIVKLQHENDLNQQRLDRYGKLIILNEYNLDDVYRVQILLDRRVIQESKNPYDIITDVFNRLRYEAFNLLLSTPR